MKKLFFAIVAIAAFGCSSDDNGISKSDIVGMWHPVATAIGSGDFVNHADACISVDDYLEIALDEINYMEYYFYNSDCGVKEMQSGWWKLSGKKLVLASFDPAVHSDLIYQIISVDNTELVLSYMLNEETKKVKFERVVSGI